MKTTMIKTTILAVATAIGLSVTPMAVAQQDGAKSLQELLNLVKRGQARENREAAEREQRFIAARGRQEQLLEEAKAALAAEEARSAALEKKYEEQDLLITDKERVLNERLGTLKELFGHLTSSMGDLRSVIDVSLTSIQYPNRQEFIDGMIAKMKGAEELPSIEEIERVWFEMQRELIASGEIATFSTEVTSVNGEKSQQDVVRVGVFNVVNSDGEYLVFKENGSVAVLARQPSGKYLDWGSAMAANTGGQDLMPFGADPTGPSGGTYLSALIDSPTIKERWQQGGVVGYIITAVGVFAVLIAIWRLIVLTLMYTKVKSQLSSSTANTNNPLGRVLKVHEDNPHLDPETLELKLDEAVLKEKPAIESMLELLKIIAAVAPLLGLLGTVTGMILTFQAITIFGAGDPKAMAGGISSALITTVLGLCVAIPTVLLHTVVSERAKKITHILDEQSTGLIAEHSEASHNTKAG